MASCQNCGETYEGPGVSNNGWNFCSDDCLDEKRYELEKDKG